MERFDIVGTPLDGAHVLERRPISDARGFLERLYCFEELAVVLGTRRIAQVNRTLTKKRGSVRGMHFQASPHAETKIVTCLRGRVCDVAVDVRAGSPSFLRWHAVELDGSGTRAYVIPEGFAHGFQALTDDCELLYLHTAPYAPASEVGLHPLDPRLSIEWPLPIADLSPRDAAHPKLTEAFPGVAS